VVKILDLGNDVVVKLQNRKFRESCQVVDLNNVFIRECQVVQLPQRHVIFVKDFVLLVVLNQVKSNEIVVDDRWANL
jgi:hypothetical protein